MSTNDDEINLIDYIKVVIKRKWLILGITLTAVLIAGIASMVSPKNYEVSTTLQIGNTTDILESTAQVAEKIKSNAYKNLLEEKLNIENLPEIKTETPQNTNFVSIIIETDNPEQAKQILDEINSLVLLEHQEIFNKRESQIKENIKEIQDELTLLETKKEYSEGIAELRIKLSDLKATLNVFQPTKVIKAPIVPKNPSGSNLILNIVIAIVLGLFIGVLVAFIKEWWENAKKELKEI
ncbi:MAG TPA: Wzz/FepE/Etk N-terminal domain-containing protein [Candidatus Pacearchaeota archaeon]|mgnify:CR=1 FL=1|nr:Wzz/FepE/Etk N-terminal domain-containing protein [Candidatus Pacearchaeota archaeon]HQD89084.1 Wzz/FepE/Etk N-terminal domain-containing protein [Candidatus Pacearchaeota archaeon]